MYQINSIGTVQADEQGFYIEVDKRYQAALKEVHGFSHIHLLWWAHLADTKEARSITVTPKPYKNAPDEIGIFATRSPLRPNPIADTIVFVIRIDDNKIRIPYVDAEVGTPIVDIKPYHPCTDRVRNVSVPEWCSHWPQYYEDSAHFDWESEFVYEE